MPGAAHEPMVKVLKEHPAWFDLLLKTLKRRGLPKGLRLDDSALQAVLTIDRRPDVFWLHPRRSWALAEVQVTWQAEKVASWIVTVARLVAEHKVMGDLFRVTVLPSVATKEAPGEARGEARAGLRRPRADRAVVRAGGDGDDGGR